MKILDIALKDLKRTFLSAFSLVMMFGAPLLITGLLYFAFGELAAGGEKFNLPATKVVVVNLDRPGAQNPEFAAGEMLIEFLEAEALSDVVTVSRGADESEARAAVDSGNAGVAIVIPPDFTEAAITPGRTAAVGMVQDPTLTIGPAIVRDLVSHFMDGFSGAKIAAQTTTDALNAHGLGADPREAAQAYIAWLEAGEHEGGGATPRISLVSPAGQAQAGGQEAISIGPIMAGMIIFFVFFMGANGAESIIHEDETGTLPRLFTTPTAQIVILGGKFLGVVVSLGLQVALLLIASSLLFDIAWGQPVTVFLVALGLIVAAAGFGVMLMSFIKNSRQTGPVLGGVMTLTGMLGGLFTTGMPNVPAAMATVSLLTPHGWALRGWTAALSGAGPLQSAVPVLVLLAMGIGFLSLGAILFRRRFA